MGLAFREGAAGASSHLSHGKGPSEPPAGNGGPDSRRYRARACALLRKFRWNHGQFVRPEPIGSGRFCFLGARQEAGGMDEAYQNQTGRPSRCAACPQPADHPPVTPRWMQSELGHRAGCHDPCGQSGLFVSHRIGQLVGCYGLGNSGPGFGPAVFHVQRRTDVGAGHSPFVGSMAITWSDWWRRCTFGHSFTGCTT